MHYVAQDSRRPARSTSSRSARSSTASIPASSRSARPRPARSTCRGGEFNCAANLADCFGLRTAIATAMVDYPIGELIAGQVRAMGVTPFYKMFKHDGVRGPNMATVYSDRGLGVRGPVVFYNRANEAAAQLKPGDFDWKAIFGGGVRWFHSGGIFASLSETTAELIIEAMKAAKAARRGRVVRPELSREAVERRGRRRSRGRRCSAGSSSTSTCSSATKRTCRRGSALTGPQVAAKSKLDPSAFFDMIERVVARFPNIKVVATTLREVHSTNRHAWGAVPGSTARPTSSPTCELDVFDRVGGGDGFASGFIYGLLSGASPDEAVAPRLGARRAADDVPRRHDDGEPGAGARVRAQGGSARIAR